MINKIFHSLIIFICLITFANAESSWIKKKDKSEKKVEKVIKTSNEWIKKKIKEDKKDYSKEEKKITKEIKSWITKKSKDEYIESIDKLPDGAIYFTASNETKDLLVYGYVLPDTNSRLINNYYETSKGFGYFNDGKTTCKIGSTIIDVTSDEVTNRVSGECSNGIKFTGNASQNQNSGMGLVKTKDGKNRFLFDFNIQKEQIAKLFEKNLQFAENSDQLIERKIAPKTRKNIKLKPNGKYYALLIGNSQYDDEGWDDLVSPINDINAIEDTLNKKFVFEKILTVKNGTKKEIFNAFKNLSKITTTNDYVLIYYSGHGETKATQAYWVPKDGSAEWGNGDWININELNIFLTQIKAHHLAVMVDSCYVGGKFKGTNILDLTNNDDAQLFSNAFKDNLQNRARIVLSSGSTGRVSDTAPNSKNSIFASSFLNLLNASEKMSVPVNMLSVALNINRAFVGNFNQKPYYYHPDTWAHGGGDFIFIPKKNIQ